jgi:hypothetical protein
MLCTGCIGAFDYSYKKQIIGRYYLSAIDSRETMTVCYNPNDDALVEILPPAVFAVGHDSDLIVIKQHPGEYNPNKRIINYYIVSIRKKPWNFPEKEVIGPLTREQFTAKMTELGRNIPFTTVFKDLE